MRKLILLLALAISGCSNWQIWSAGTVASGLTSLVDFGVTTTPDFTYRIDVCLLAPEILGFHSGPDTWSGYATGFKDGKLVMGSPVQCTHPWSAT